MVLSRREKLSLVSWVVAVFRLLSSAAHIYAKHHHTIEYSEAMVIAVLLKLIPPSSLSLTNIMMPG